MDYGQLESDIVTRLAANVVGEVDFVRMPNNQSEYVRPSDTPRVTVSFDSSDYLEETTSGEVISQPEMIKMIITLNAFSLRGELGVYDLKTKVRDVILGWTPPNCDKPITFKFFGPPNVDPAFIDNMWFFELHIVTRTAEVQTIVPAYSNVVDSYQRVSENTTVHAPLITLNEQ